MSNFTKGATYRTAAAQPDMSTRAIEPAALAIIPLPSDAPAATIARLSVELAASQAHVARTAEALKDLSEWRCGCRGSADECSCLTIIREQASAALSSATDDIAVPRERYDRMVKALGMGRELAQAADGYARQRSTNGLMMKHRDRRDEILAAMDAAGKA